MANIWQYVNEKRWAPTELHSAAVLGRGDVDFVGDCNVVSGRGEVVLYPGAADLRAAQWMLLAPPGAQARLNGAPLDNGIRVLADRDAIRVADMFTMYFSTERLCCVESFAGAEPVYCPRCKMMIAAGDSAVCCSQCGVWHHEQVSEGRGCWSYADTCALCDQSTELDAAAFRWTPAELWS